jgi:hypothetical protein
MLLQQGRRPDHSIAHPNGLGQPAKTDLGLKGRDFPTPPSSPPYMHISTVVLVLLCFAISRARAGNDDSLDNYLREKGITAAECHDRSPSELMGLIEEREKLGHGGTTGHMEDAATHFYQTYLAALQPAVDARFPKAKALRRPLQKLHCFIFDSMQSMTHDRTYITHERIAAYTEHVLESLYESGETLDFAAESKPTAREVAAFARLKAAISFNTQIVLRPNYVQYSTRFLRHLKSAEGADPKISAYNLRIHVVDFVNKYVPLLDSAF